jgi:uncharacterized protein (DUF488 family)
MYCSEKNNLGMEKSGDKLIWTIGHSTRSMQELVAMLRSFKIELVADIRSYPGSRRYPHFNKEALNISLPGNDIEYIHLKQLGGRRKADPHSANDAWRHEAFRGFADYMDTDDFKEGVENLQQIAFHKRTACMCSEAVWWRCHRALISDYLKSVGWTVMHIMNRDGAEEHSYTSPARIIDGKLTYKQAGEEPSLFKE